MLCVRVVHLVLFCCFERVCLGGKECGAWSACGCGCGCLSACLLGHICASTHNKLVLFFCLLVGCLQVQHTAPAQVRPSACRRLRTRRCARPSSAGPHALLRATRLQSMLTTTTCALRAQTCAQTKAALGRLPASALRVLARCSGRRACPRAACAARPPPFIVASEGQRPPRAPTARNSRAHGDSRPTKLA